MRENRNKMELKKAQAALNKNQKNKWGKSTTTTNKSTALSSDKKASLSDTKKYNQHPNYNKNLLLLNKLHRN